MTVHVPSFSVRHQVGRLDMSDIKSELVSRRRVLAFLGLTTLAVTVPTVLTMSDAEAQQPAPPTATPAAIAARLLVR